MQKRVLSILLLTFFGLLAVQSVQAVPVTINIEATVTQVVDHGLNGGWLGGQVKVNDVIKGHYTYESTTPDTNPSGAVGVYRNGFTPSGISLSIGSLHFQTDSRNVALVVNVAKNHPDYDFYAILSYVNLPLTLGERVQLITWKLYDFTCTALASDALPTTAPMLSQWSSNSLTINGDCEFDYTVLATVTNATVVPEPATILLLAAGAVFVSKSRLNRNGFDCTCKEELI